MKMLLSIACAALLAAAPAVAEDEVTAPTGYVPGVGDMMSAIQMRHAKIWYGFTGKNWALVDYEIDELNEGFADVLHWHPTFAKVSQPMATLFAAFVDKPMAGLQSAARERNARKFVRAYDELTAACNACHVASSFAFNRVVTPKAGAFPNQDFRKQP